MNGEKKVFVSLNPANGETVWKGQAAGPPEIEAAIGAARDAFPSWVGRTLEERSRLLKAFAEELETRKTHLAEIISREIGKPLWEARTEIAAMIGKVEVSLRAQAQRCSEFIGGPAVTRFRPHGVMVVLGPYNFPGHLPNGHIVPALLAGNVVLFKPSELAPATAEATLACWEAAGLPPGVLQLIQGERESAQQLVSHPEVKGILFTGSASTGKALSRQFADSPGKMLALEMGGNNPLIVDTGHISDLEAAVEIVLHSAFLSTGQRCTCARRLIIISSPGSGRFIKRLVIKATALRIDDPFADPPPFMGPLASHQFPDKILSAQAALVASGGAALLEAKALRPGTGFISPGIVDATGIADPGDEEIFGPLLQIFRVENLDTAIRTANKTRYGLASGILTDNAAHHAHAYARLQAGIVNWNTPLTGASSAAPFGGIGDSGNHRPSAFLAADYCSYPVASMEKPRCEPPPSLP